MKSTGTDSANMVRVALWLQGALAACAMLIALAPAPDGTAVYIPLTRRPAAETVAWAQANGVGMLGRGPLPGSMLVRSDRTAQLALDAFSRGAILISVPAALCGDPATTTKSDSQ
jgi:hypothetical protein